MRNSPRRDPRFNCALPVTLVRANGKAILATVRDVSLGGVRVEPSAALQPGDVVRIRFGAPMVCEVRARVAWSAPRSMGGQAGLVFVLHPTSEAVVRRLVADAERAVVFPAIASWG